VYDVNELRVALAWESDPEIIAILNARIHQLEEDAAAASRRRRSDPRDVLRVAYAASTSSDAG
jgi:hypothetical protein